MVNVSNILGSISNLYAPVMVLVKSLGMVVWNIALAAIFLAVSVWILGLLKSLAEWVLDVLSIEKLADMLGINGIIKKVSPAGFSTTLVNIFYWISMIGILIGTLNILGVGKSISKTIDYMVSMLPNLLSALFVIIVATLVAGFAANLVKLIASYFGNVNEELYAKATSFVVLLYATLVAIGQLDIITPDLLNTGLVIAFIGFALAAALGSTKEAATTLKTVVAKVKMAALSAPKKKATKKKRK